MSSKRRSKAVPCLEDAVEFVQDRYDLEFGQVRVRTADRERVQSVPGFYCPPNSGLDSDDYQWIVDDGFFDGKTVWCREDEEHMVNVFPPIDLAPLPSTSSRPHTVPTNPTIFQKRAMKFEERREFFKSSVRLLKQANASSLSRSTSPSLYDGKKQRQRPASQGSVPMLPKPSKVLSYVKNGPQETRPGIDGVPILKSGGQFNPVEVEKAFTKRTYGEDSVMNIRHDSQFYISENTVIPIAHISTCLYRNDRKYGFLFDQKALKRDKRRRQNRDGPKRAHTSYGEKLSNALKTLTLEEPSQIPLPALRDGRPKTPALSIPPHEEEEANLPLSAREAEKEDVFSRPVALDLPSLRSSFLQAPSSESSPLGERGVKSLSRASQSLSSRLLKEVSKRLDVSTSPLNSPKVGSLAVQSGSEEVLIETAPVAFTYSSHNTLKEVHLQSQIPKDRPLSAGQIQSLTKKQSSRLARAMEFNAKEMERRMQEMMVLRLKRTRKSYHPRKDLSNIHRISSDEELFERDALMDIFRSCQGNGWIRKDNWCDPDKPVKYWFGVGVTVEGHVFEINLPGNNLRGLFPDDISRLPYLETVMLDHNHLEGGVPDYAFQKCHHLQIISVQYNQLSGEVAFENFCHLQELREVWLTGNKLTGPIQDSVCKLTALTHLCLAKNAFVGNIPDQIGKLQNLLYLSLGENQLEGVVPQSIVGLHQLQTLSLHSNKLTGRVPDWLFALTSLEDLFLFNNNFENNEETLKHIHEEDEQKMRDQSNKVQEGIADFSVLASNHMVGFA
eukprot:gene2287-2503_t